MGIVLARIDDRLIHGQVTVGWCQSLRPDRILLANNAIAADDWQCEVYRSSVPPAIQVSILSMAESVSHLKNIGNRDEAVLVLTASAFDMAELLRMGAPIREVNVGGVHFSAGKREMLPFVYVDKLDLRSMRRLVEMGGRLAAQQVPGGREHPLTYEVIQAMEAGF